MAVEGAHVVMAADAGVAPPGDVDDRPTGGPGDFEWWRLAFAFAALLLAVPFMYVALVRLQERHVVREAETIAGGSW